MDQDKQISLFSCLLPEMGDVEPMVDAFISPQTQNYEATPVRLVPVQDVNGPDDGGDDDDEEEEDEDSEQEKKQKGRTRNPENWVHNVRKFNKNRGLAYRKANGELCEEKVMGPPCTCKMKCFKSLGQEACQKVFNNFWKLGDYSLQNAYIAGCVRIMLPKSNTKKCKEPGRRFYTRCFYVNVNGVDTEVCKKAFLSMHCVSNGRLDRLLKKKQESGNTGVDARGRHNNKANKIPLQKIREVRRSIDGFRKRAGFTGKRKSKSVELLPVPLNIRSMYRTYRDEVVAKGKEPVCEFRYRKIFHNDFHIDFVRPSNYVPNAAQPDSSKPETVQTTDYGKVDTEPVFTLEEKPVYTTLEGSSKDDAATYVTVTANDFYNGGYTLQPQNWVFTGQS